MGRNFEIKCIKDCPTLAYEGEIVKFEKGKAKWMNGSESLMYRDVKEFFRLNKSLEEYFVEFKEMVGFKVGDKVVSSSGIGWGNGKEYRIISGIENRVISLEDSTLAWRPCELKKWQPRKPIGKGGDETICSKIKPSYYNNSKITPFDYIKANKLDFFEGNVIKYITRYKSKNGMEDLLKAKTYLEEIIKGYEEENEL